MFIQHIQVRTEWRYQRQTNILRTKLSEGHIVPIKDNLNGNAKTRDMRSIESSAGADFLGEDVVDGEVVADEEEVAELDLLLPQQALAPRDLPHLGQDLKPAKNNNV